MILTGKTMHVFAVSVIKGSNWYNLLQPKGNVIWLLSIFHHPL